MATYPVLYITDDGPVFEKPVDEILGEVLPGGAIKVLTALECITGRQRRWYKGICLTALVKNDENGETKGWWDTEVKKLCKGLDYLKKEIFYVETGLGERIPIGRLTTDGVGKMNMTLFIEEILSQAMQRGWPVNPPDPELRAK